MRKVCELGRSMVEMLGVLAIIGVLSVGGIVGYSTAMFKHKLNKHAQQLTSIFNLAARYSNSLQFNGANIYNSTGDFIALGEIPDEMIKNETNDIYDIFNNKIRFQTYGLDFTTGESWNPAGSLLIAITLDPSENETSVAICRNVINSAKETKNNVWYFETIGLGNSRVETQYYGNNFCTNKNSCISTLTIKKIDNMCRGFAEQFANLKFQIWFK
ncbi:MAG: hypothetical protein IJ019_01240 [Alphaproteobacteria bacterium]|nr:hypothetical protein [Alphaproteobacteria bacterium]